MLRSGLSTRKKSLLLLHVRALRTIHAKFQPQAIRSRSTAASPSTYISKRPSYPERLLIYHAGTGRTVFIGCLKVTTIFIFVFFAIVVFPSHFFSDDESSSWVAVAVLLSGVLPMAFVMYVSGPFVTYIHIRLPPYARQSRDLLMRYSNMLPKDAELELTTMNFVGKPRAARMKVSDLVPVKQRFGLANYARDTRDINSKRPWWMGKAVRLFGIHGGSGRIPESGIWDNVARSICKRQNLT